MQHPKPARGRKTTDEPPEPEAQLREDRIGDLEQLAQATLDDFFFSTSFKSALVSLTRDEDAFFCARPCKTADHGGGRLGQQRRQRFRSADGARTFPRKGRTPSGPAGDRIRAVGSAGGGLTRSYIVCPVAPSIRQAAK
jgi:hypothetical protein